MSKAPWLAGELELNRKLFLDHVPFILRGALVGAGSLWLQFTLVNWEWSQRFASSCQGLPGIKYDATLPSAIRGNPEFCKMDCPPQGVLCNAMIPSCTALWTHHHRCPLVLGRPLFIALVGYKNYLKSALLWWHMLSTRLRTLSGHLMKVQFTQSPNVEMLESEIVGSSTHNQLSKTVWSLSHSFWTVPETVCCSPQVWALLYPFAIPSQY